MSSQDADEYVVMATIPVNWQVGVALPSYSGDVRPDTINSFVPAPDEELEELLDDEDKNHHCALPMEAITPVGYRHPAIKNKSF